ncbi:formate dehydrogenase subunit gamma [Halotalea alkalilenta]|uniref:Formate dehydrogenase n=1 Tax=Halotalea alkalilenta TaxID=376489 RepID=A0A172YES7_9GAMM|nr:formate dehydrogenase subunit gamma [Halotalea alkalilenta]ANF57724.1 formate dehydrogenase [Halotalea alkalilenta]
MKHDEVKRNQRGQRMMLRYPASTRVNHWTMAVSFILLALSGLAFFHPAFFFLSHTLGGPVWARILHPFIGVVFFLLFVAIAVSNVRYNLWIKNDLRWVRQIGDVLGNHDERLPPIGKFNPGQKLVFWCLVISVPLLLVTGVIMWRPWFAGYFPIPLIRLASLLHALAAFVAIATIIVHIYAAIWVKGSIRAMTRGWVSRAWAKHHHPLWYEDHVDQDLAEQRKARDGQGERPGAERDLKARE